MPMQCIRLTALFVFLSMAGMAHAEGFALYEYSARGIALGGSLVARKPDASAVAYNPALMTRLPGIHLMGGVSAVTPDGKMRSSDPTTGKQETTSLKPSTWLIPHAYYTQQLNERFSVGVGEFSRFGLGFEYPHDWPGRFNIYQVSLRTMSVNPNIAWAVTDKLSLAAGVEVVYATIDLKKRTNVPIVPGVASFEVDSNIQDAEGYGLGGNLALHYQFNEQWAVGLLYRSQAEVRASGDVQYSYIGYKGPQNPALENAARNAYTTNFKDGEAHATVILPDSVAGGISWTPIPELSVEIGATWTNWSTFRALNLHLPEPIHGSPNPKHWRDTWRFNVGLEYEPLDWLALRLGYVYDQSPMTRRHADYLVPTNDRHIYSLGVGFKWDAWTVDLAYAYIQPLNRSYSYREDNHVLDSKTRGTSTSIFSLSLGYQF